MIGRLELATGMLRPTSHASWTWLIKIYHHEVRFFSDASSMCSAITQTHFGAFTALETHLEQWRF